MIHKLSFYIVNLGNLQKYNQQSVKIHLQYPLALDKINKGLKSIAFSTDKIKRHTEF